MRDARNATYRHLRTAARINNADVPVVERGRRERKREREKEKRKERDGEEEAEEENDEEGEEEEEAGRER